MPPIILLWILCGCNITKKIPQNQSLLVKNNVNVIGVEKDYIYDFFYKDDLFNIPVQKPNKRFLGFIPLGLGVWSIYQDKPLSKFNQFMRTKVGSEPVLFDSLLLEKSELRFNNYYQNKGYFDNTVSADYTTKHKKTTVNFNVTPKDAYTYRKFSFDTTTVIQKWVQKNTDNSLLHSGDRFDANILKNERERIVSLINNKGYFYFNKEYVFFRLDTNRKDKTIDLQVKILKASDTADFAQYHLDSVFVIISKNETQAIDSQSVVTIKNVKFIQPKEKFYSEKFLQSFFVMKDDSLYSKERNQLAMQRLMELDNFRLVNNGFSVSPHKENTLNSLFSLVPSKKQFFSFGINAYNSSQGLLGSSLTFAYNNRNLTKHADQLKISLSGALEFNFTLQSNSVYKQTSLISRSDLSLQANYTINKLMTPFHVNTDHYLTYKTNFLTKITYEKRINYYDLYNVNSSFGYTWIKNPKFLFVYNPFSFSYIYSPVASQTANFQEILSVNPYLRSSFTNTFIFGSNFQFSYFTNSRFKRSKFGSKWNLETAGNSLYLLNKVVPLTENSDDKITLFGEQVSQYFKVLNENIYSFQINKPTSLHVRLKLGAGFGFGNATELPYIKQFFLGGPYSIRSFPLRQIGPGSTDITQISVKDQTGNLLLEGNLEYRFKIISFFNGALFTDYGNIWRTGTYSDKYSKFDISTFYKQFYIGGGFGLRFDFEYIAIRMDLGFPIRVPYYSGSDSWVIQDAQPFNSTWVRQNMVFNIAVGYPF